MRAGVEPDADALRRGQPRDLKAGAAEGGGDGAHTTAEALGGADGHPASRTAGTAAFEQAGLLAGLDGEEREQRLALLQRLSSEGVSLRELQRHTGEGTIVFLPAERVIGGPRRYTAAEVAALAGEEVGFLLSARRAMGLPLPAPDERGYIEADVEALRTAGAFRSAGIADEEVLETLRILGRGLSQSAEAMRSLALRLVLEPGLGEDELAERYASAARQLAPMLGPVVSNLLLLHLRQVADSEALSAAERRGGRLPGSREVAIGFADLVGFTRLGEQLLPHELSRLALRLEELAIRIVAQPVRLVKTIGDAVMLTSAEATPLLAVALELIDAADAEGPDFPQLRAGVAFGPALSRAGDWFGQPVNLASRITQIAHPGSVLLTAEVREQAAGDFRFSYAGERRLRGVRDPVRLYRARPHPPRAGG